MKKTQLWLSTLALPLDYAMLIVAGLSAYGLRFKSFVTDYRPIYFNLPLGDYLPTLAVAALLWLFLFAISGLYQINQHIKFSKEIGRVFVACTAGLSLIILLFFFNPNLFNSRFIVLVGWALSIFFVSLGRVVLRLWRTYLYKHGLASVNIILIGNDNSTDEIEKLFSHNLKLGFRIICRLRDIDSVYANEQLKEADEIIVGDTSLNRTQYLKLVDYCLYNHLGFRYAADMFEAQSHNVVVHTFAGIPLVEIKRTSLDGWGRVVKRCVDIVLSLILIILLIPVWLIVGLIIVVTSGWPIFVSLVRVGERRNEFKLYKFRSMILNAHLLKAKLLAQNERADGPLFKMTNDPRITKVGKYLRYYSIDELPQLWNVLKGEMSLVGPRPHEPSEVALYKQNDFKLLNIKPGITGLSQISGRSNLSFEDEAKLDIFYVENWSIWTDFVILIKTLVVVLQRRNAV